MTQAPTLFGFLEREWAQARDPGASFLDRWAARVALPGLGLIGCLICMIPGLGLAEILSAVSDPGRRERVLVVSASAFWAVGFALISAVCWNILHRDKVLPQLLSSPLSPRRLFRRKLRPLGVTGLIALLATIVMFLGFAMECRSQVPTGVLLALALLQGAIAVVASLTIAVFCFRLYVRALLTLFAVAVLFALCFSTVNQSAVGKTAAAALGNWFWHSRVLDALALFPGSWVAHLFSAIFFTHSAWIPWLALTLSGLALGAVAIWRGLPKVYRAEAILRELYGPPALTHPMEAIFRRVRLFQADRSGRPYPSFTDLRELLPAASRGPWRAADEFYERLFAPREQGILALLLKRDLAGTLGLCAMMTTDAAVLSWIAAASLRLPDYVVPGSPSAHVGFVSSVCGISLFLGLAVWLFGGVEVEGRTRLASPEHEPLCELVPSPPEEQLRILLRFSSLLGGGVWLVYLPVIILWPAPAVWRLWFAVNSLAGILGIAPFFFLVYRLSLALNPRRSLATTILVALGWLLGIVLELVLLAAALAVDSRLFPATSPWRYTGVGGWVLVSALWLFPVWLFVMRRRRYDVCAGIRLT